MDTGIRGSKGAVALVACAVAMAVAALALKAALGTIVEAPSAQAATVKATPVAEEVPDAALEPFDAASVPDPSALPEGQTADALREAVAAWAEASSVPRLSAVAETLCHGPDSPEDTWVWCFTGQAGNGQRVDFQVTWSDGVGFSCQVLY